MRKVFVVTEGDYSDYHLCGIFTSREKAEQYFAEARRPNDYSVEEWELDTTPRVLRHIYSEVLSVKDGSRWVNEQNVHQDGSTQMSSDQEVSQGYRGEWGFVRWAGIGRTPYVYDQTVTHIFAKSAISQEHATKLAAEGRQAFLRNPDMDTTDIYYDDLGRGDGLVQTEGQ